MTPANHPPGQLNFEITDTKLYVPVVTLSNDRKRLEQVKKGLKKTIKWNKYRSQMTIQPQNNNLNYLIDPRFMNVNRLFVSQEIIILIVDIPFQIVMYQRLESMTLMF